MIAIYTILTALTAFYAYRCYAGLQRYKHYIERPLKRDFNNVIFLKYWR